MSKYFTRTRLEIITDVLELLLKRHFVKLAERAYETNDSSVLTLLGSEYPIGARDYNDAVALDIKEMSIHSSSRYDTYEDIMQSLDDELTYELDEFWAEQIELNSIKVRTDNRRLAVDIYYERVYP
jgi:hypothetical protein